MTLRAPALPERRRRGRRRALARARAARRRRRRASRSASPPASRAPTAWCSGPASPASACRERVDGALGSRRRRGLPAHRRARRRDRRGRVGAQRPRRAGRPRAGALVLVSLQRARRAERRRPHAHRAGAPTPRRRCASRSPAASAGTSATTRPGAMSPDADLDLVLFLGDYIYEYATPQGRDPPRRRRRGLHARPVPRPLRDLQERPAAAGRARARRRG